MAKLVAARDRWTKVSGKKPSIILCYEAGYDVPRFLKARGIDCLGGLRPAHSIFHYTASAELFAAIAISALCPRRRSDQVRHQNAPVQSALGQVSRRTIIATMSRKFMLYEGEASRADPSKDTKSCL